MSHIERRRVEREARRAQIAREASGEARGFRYAIECNGGWVGPWHRTGPRVHDDCCTYREPVVYNGDRASAQARAQEHNESRRYSGGALHHSAFIVPESEIPRRLAVHRLG